MTAAEELSEIPVEGIGTFQEEAIFRETVSDEKMTPQGPRNQGIPHAGNHWGRPKSHEQADYTAGSGSGKGWKERLESEGVHVLKVTPD